MANFKEILDTLSEKLCKKDEYNRKLILITKKLKELSEALGV